jgi:hypothetical protein
VTYKKSRNFFKFWVTKFGIWEIHKNFGIVGRVNPSLNYKIGKETLWDTTDYKGHIVWDWLIHLTGKTWINKKIYNDFIIAFVFALDYFKKYKPNNAKEGSISQSIY